MLSFCYKKSLFQILETSGSGNSVNPKVKPDLIVEFDLLLATPKFSDLHKGMFSFRLVLPNYVINLTDDEDEIFSRFHKNNRYKINRAKNRDDLLFHELTSPTDSEIETFKEFFNPFAKEKNIEPCDVNKLKAIRDQGALVMTSITDQNHQALCYHVYQKDDIQTLLLHSGSIRYNHADSNYRSLVGRANRYLHWKDIQSFKNKGCKWYNWGCKLFNEKDSGEQNVNKFKTEFGTINGFDSRIFYSNTLMGKLGLIPLYLKWRKNAENKFKQTFYFSPENL
jgi:hypothetical protein